MENSKRIQNIHQLCVKYEISDYDINQDGSIDVYGNVFLYKKGLTELPLRFNIVTGNFNCRNNKLTNLKHCPVEVGGDFDCSHNKLQSLINSPKVVVGIFDCTGNYINSLKYLPRILSNGLKCSYNKLNSLNHIPEQLGFLECSNNRLKTLEYLSDCKINNHIIITGNHLVSLDGAPSTVHGDFKCSFNKLISLRGIPNVINGNLFIDNNLLRDLDYFPGSLNGALKCQKNKFNYALDATLKKLTKIQLPIFCKYFKYYEVFDPEFNKDNYDNLMIEIQDGLE